MGHREAKSRKKHSATLGQKPFPSCVTQTPYTRKAVRGSALPLDPESWKAGNAQLLLLSVQGMSAVSRGGVSSSRALSHEYRTGGRTHYLTYVDLLHQLA